VLNSGANKVARSRWLLIVLGALAGVLVAVTWSQVVPPPLFRDEMPGGLYHTLGQFDPPGNALGFYDPERLPDGTTYRWAGPQATLTFPYAAQAGRAATISLRLAAAWAPSQPPAAVTIRVNGQRGAQLTVSHDFQVVRIPLDTARTPNPYLDPTHIQVDIDSTPSSVPGDPRTLGVVVDWVQVQPERSEGEIAAAALVWGLVLAGVLVVATTRFGLTWSLVYGGLALLSFVGLQGTYLPRAIAPTTEVALAGLAWMLAAGVAPRTRPGWGLALAAGGLWLVIAGRVMGDWQMDDAYISYRYAWNLIHGQGLVYNPGEVVEGYTNFLWTVLAGGAIAGGIPPAHFALAANITVSLGLLALTAALAGRLAGGGARWPLVAAGVLVVDDGLLTYGARGSGMEAALFALLVLGASAALWAGRAPHVRRWRALGGVVLAAAALTRPEGLLVAAIFLGVRTLRDRVEGGPVWARLAAGAGPFLAITGIYQIWRWSFYGYPFPNTFYAKTGTTAALLARGWDHAHYFLIEHWLVVALATAGLGVAALEWWPGASRLDRRGFGLGRGAGLRSAWGLLILGQVAYILWVGDDYFPGWRFFVPILAPLALLAGEAARFIGTYLPRSRLALGGAGGTLAAALVLYALGMGWYQEPDSVIGEETRLHAGYVDHWGSAGLWLRANTPPDTRTAVKGAGAIAYYSRRPMLDAYGLNDLHIGHLPVANMGAGRAGHEKEDPLYVLDQQPDYILELDSYLGPLETRFKQEYTLRRERSPTGLMIDWWQRNTENRP
jgi:hypothetical protein